MKGGWECLQQRLLRRHMIVVSMSASKSNSELILHFSQQVYLQLSESHRVMYVLFRDPEQCICHKSKYFALRRVFDSLMEEGIKQLFLKGQIYNKILVIFN